LPTAPLGKEATFYFIFLFAFRIDKHTHTHATIHNTYISHPQVHTHHMCPQVHPNKSTNPQSVSNPTKQVHNMINKVQGPTVTAGAVGKVGWATRGLAHHLEPGDSNPPRKATRRRQDCKC
jgi:hypothetical protein